MSGFSLLDMYLIRWVDLGSLEKSSELTTRRVDVTKRGPTSRLLEKVEPKKSARKRSDEEGP